MLNRFTLLISCVFICAGCDGTQQQSTRSLNDILNLTSSQVERQFEPDQIERGASIFQTHCENCHGKDAQGTPDWRKPKADGKFPPPPLNGTAHTWHHSTAVLKHTILNGGPPEVSTMPAWKDILTEQQVDDVIVWIKSLWSDEIYATWYQNIEER